MKITSKSVSAVLEDFRSSAPTPGGGSAAALAGALGASLLVMVASLPKPRAANAHELQQLAEAGRRCADLARQLEALVDADSDAYDLVMSAYRLPKATDEEKAARSARIQDALKAATDTPLNVMRACASAIAEGAAVASYGNANASSDVNVGLELLRAGREGARLNVAINLESIKNHEYVESVRDESRRLCAADTRPETR